MFNFSDTYMTGMYISMIVNFIFAIGYMILYKYLDKFVDIKFESTISTILVMGIITSIIWPIQAIGFGITLVFSVITYAVISIIKRINN